MINIFPLRKTEGRLIEETHKLTLALLLRFPLYTYICACMPGVCVCTYYTIGAGVRRQPDGLTLLLLSLWGLPGLNSCCQVCVARELSHLPQDQKTTTTTHYILKILPLY